MTNKVRHGVLAYDSRPGVVEASHGLVDHIDGTVRVGLGASRQPTEVLLLIAEKDRSPPSRNASRSAVNCSYAVTLTMS